MKIRQCFGTNKALESDGKWCDLAEGARIKVARVTNEVYQNELERLLAPHRARIRSGQDLPREVVREITIKAMAKGVIRDWSGITDDHGAEIPFSVEMAERLLTELPDFRDVVTAYASEAANYRAEIEVAVAKN